MHVERSGLGERGKVTLVDVVAARRVAGAPERERAARGYRAIGCSQHLEAGCARSDRDPLGFTGRVPVLIHLDGRGSAFGGEWAERDRKPAKDQEKRAHGLDPRSKNRGTPMLPARES